MATWRDVRRIALSLPSTSEEVSGSGKAMWYVASKWFAWERPLRRADLEALGDDAPSGPILLVPVADLEMKDVLLQSDPNAFFTTPHFDGYPGVLIRLQTIKVPTLKDVVIEAWLSRAPKRIAAAFLANQ